MKIIFVLIGLLLPLMTFSQNESKWVYRAKDGHLEYKTTLRGDRIMDYSHAGYMGGGVALPDVGTVINIPWDETDRFEDYSSIIQAAIDSVSGLEMKNGFRGAVQLSGATYYCAKSIVIEADGVVLRGSGGNGQLHTTISMVDNGVKRPAVIIGRRHGKRGNPISSAKVTASYIPFGTRLIPVENPSMFKAGDRVQISKPVTREWIKAMNMDDMYRDGIHQTWIKAGTILNTERIVESVSPSGIVVTVPLADCYDRTFTHDSTYVSLVDAPDLVRNSGVENLRIVSPLQAVNHTKARYYGIRINGEDCWASNIELLETMESVACHGQRITLSKVSVTRTALHQGASKPAEFAPNAGQILLDRCSVNADNVWFVAVGAQVSGPIVLLNCNFTGDGHFEGHQRWSTAFLLDNCHADGGGIDFKNRGSMGSGHGWGTAWSVAWNCSARTLVNQLPPYSNNWMIGCIGKVESLRRPFNTSGPTLKNAVFESLNNPVTPVSLYLTQLEERLGKEALRNIGY